MNNSFQRVFGFQEPAFNDMHILDDTKRYGLAFCIKKGKVAQWTYKKGSWNEIVSCLPNPDTKGLCAVACFVLNDDNKPVSVFSTLKLTKEGQKPVQMIRDLSFVFVDNIAPMEFR